MAFLLYLETNIQSHLWYFCVNGVFMHPVFCGFEDKLYCNIVNIFLLVVGVFAKNVTEK